MSAPGTQACVGARGQHTGESSTFLLWNAAQGPPPPPAPRQSQAAAHSAQRGRPHLQACVCVYIGGHTWACLCVGVA